MANALSKVYDDEELQKIEEGAADIERIAQEYGIEKLAELPPIGRAIRLSQGVARLNEIITVERVQFLFMGLMGKQFGFLTDKDRESNKYTAAEIQPVIIEALLRGFMPVGNEFNVIAGKFYPAKAGFERKIREFPGVSEYEVTPGTIEQAPNATALVDMTATWKRDGQLEKLECCVAGGRDTRISVKVNSGQGPDAILGKATAKIHRRVLARLIGKSTAGLLPEGDAEDAIETTVVTSDAPAVAEPKDDGRRMRFGFGKRGEAGEG